MSESYNTKNYVAHGGNEWVVGGKLTILPGAAVEGLGATPAAAEADALGSVKLASNQANSTASSNAELKADVNALLSKLKVAGIMAPDTGI